MKAIFLSVLLLIGVFANVRAQDTIRTIGGKAIPGIIQRVTPYQVSYVRYTNGRPRYTNSNGQSVARRISVSEISELVYANGRKDSMQPLPKRDGDTGSRYFTKQNYYRLGENDAKLHYKKYGGAMWGTFLATFPGSPLLGLFVGAGCVANGPTPSHFTYPNPELASSEDYKLGYAQKARRIKSGKVWGAWGAGTVLTIAAYALLTSAKK